MSFQHKKLIVYAKAVEAVTLVAILTRLIPAADSWLALQIRRAAGSMLLNIAEGAGEFKKAEKARFYRMARRSALEVSAGLDLMHHLCGVKLSAIEPLNALLNEVAAILTTIVKRLYDESKHERPRKK
jgi:four helix bundle protein